MKVRDRLPYELAMEAYEQGLECDAAARIIRATLPHYFEMVKVLVQRGMGSEYNSKKERR